MTYDIPLRSPTLTKLQKAALGYVGGYLIKVSKKRNINCWACRHNLFKRSEENEEDPDFTAFCRVKEYNLDKQRLQYSNSQLLRRLAKVFALTKIVVRKDPSQTNIFKNVSKFCLKNISFNFIKCEHSDALKHELVSQIIKLAITKHCTTVNNIIKGKDSRSLNKSTAYIFSEARKIYEHRKKRHVR